MIYVIGSLRNPKIPEVSAALREHGFEVFDDWYAAGPSADDAWRDYERGRGHTYQQALRGAAAENVFDFDHRNLTRASSVVMVLPAGKSAHLEFGWCLGRGKTGAILLDEEPERYDVMYKFATAVVTDLAGVVDAVERTERNEAARRLGAQSEAREGHCHKSRPSGLAETYDRLTILR